MKGKFSFLRRVLNHTQYKGHIAMSQSTCFIEPIQYHLRTINDHLLYTKQLESFYEGIYLFFFTYYR